MHRALERHVYAPRAGRNRRVGLNAPIVFDASVKQLIMLLSGDTLYLIPEELRTNAEGLIDYLRRHALEVVDCTPSLLKGLAAAGLLEAEGLDLTFILGGEKIDEHFWQELRQSKTLKFYNVYGPTECTVDATGAKLAVLSMIGRRLAGSWITCRRMCWMDIFILFQWEWLVNSTLPATALPVGTTDGRVLPRNDLSPIHSEGRERGCIGPEIW